MNRKQELKREALAQIDRIEETVRRGDEIDYNDFRHLGRTILSLRKLLAREKPDSPKLQEALTDALELINELAPGAGAFVLSPKTPRTHQPTVTLTVQKDLPKLLTIRAAVEAVPDAS